MISTYDHNNFKPSKEHHYRITDLSGDLGIEVTPIFGIVYIVNPEKLITALNNHNRYRYTREANPIKEIKRIRTEKSVRSYKIPSDSYMDTAAFITGRDNDQTIEIENETSDGMDNEKGSGLEIDENGGLELIIIKGDKKAHSIRFFLEEDDFTGCVHKVRLLKHFIFKILEFSKFPKIKK